MSDPVAAWRVFALDDDGGLVPPYVQHYWPPYQPWSRGVTVARCVVEDHPAPAEDCTCGLRGTVDLATLLEAMTSRHLAGSANPVLDDTGVVAKVTLSGRILDGVAVPRDDPPGTYRAEWASIVELHLAPGLTDRADAVRDRYGRTLPVRTYPDGGEDWWRQIGAQPARHGVEAYLAKVRAAGFGTSRTDDAAAPALEQVGRDVVRALRQGISGEDIGTVLFRSVAQPTRQQVRALLYAAAEHLGGGIPVAGEAEFTDPVAPGEIIARTILSFARAAR